MFQLIQMKLLLFAILAIVVRLTVINSGASDSPKDSPPPSKINEEWQKFKGANGKSYQSFLEQTTKLLQFTNNYAHVLDVNSKQSDYTFGMNKFSDLAPDQFKATYLTLQIPTQFIKKTVKNRLLQGVNLTSVDWIAKKGVTPIKNQGNCGSCWIFSAIATIQSRFKMAINLNVSLSEQEIVDCFQMTNNGVYSMTIGSYGVGCNGGWPGYAFQWIQFFYVSASAAYPYTAANQICKGNNGSTYTIGSHVQTAPTCNAVHSALMTQPVTGVLAADSFQFYTSGILTTCTGSVNHGIQIVGANLTSPAYWRIKNSWGVNWGEAGFIRIAYGDTCLVCDYGVFWVN